ncbi:MAG: hypothetical protein DHS20C15_17200 [Planctomycetota bacterium]|nr:MAG: hypothetical protein DHS20C15_17200 [Planctomycetota bacterium]
MARFALLLLLACNGCGLMFPPAPIDFREYPLPDLSYEESVDLVQEVTRAEFSRLFGGGFSMDWDPDTGNLVMSPITESSRRMRLHLHLRREGAGAVVEMLALVETLDEHLTDGKLWGEPKMDVHLEQVLYDAYLAEMVRRSESAG